MTVFQKVICWGLFFPSTGFSVDASSNRILLYPGFVTKIHCDGRLLVSAVGDESQVRLEALPKELGCGVLLKPKAKGGSTNLLLETTAGTVRSLIRIGGEGVDVDPSRLIYRLKGVLE